MIRSIVEVSATTHTLESGRFVPVVEVDGVPYRHPLLTYGTEDDAYAHSQRVVDAARRAVVLTVRELDLE